MYVVLLCLFILALLQPSVSLPLLAGQAGGDWSPEEIDIVRQKVIRMIQCSDEAGPIGWTPQYPKCWENTDLLDYSVNLDTYTKDVNNYGPNNHPWTGWTDYFARWSERRPTPSRLIQLAFHDCLRYEDDQEGVISGCDGCLNWAGMGFKSRGMDFFPDNDPFNQKGKTPTQFHTTNNKLQVSARSLELIFTDKNWPPGAPSLPESLKDSGKSRADLWQFAGNVGLELAIIESNKSGQQVGNHTAETNLCAEIGKENCKMTLDRPLPFRTGRIDCVPDPKLKWSPYDFEATRKERHSNTYGTGKKVIDDLKRDFNLTAKESIALFALHGLAVMGRNPEEAAKYKWIGGSVDQNNMKTTFSNMYHKILNGKSYHRGPLQLYNNDGFTQFQGYFLGDNEGNTVGGTAFYFSCHIYWNTTGRSNGGPCNFVPTTPGCSFSAEDKNRQVRYPCFTKVGGNKFERKNVPGCETAELIDRDGFKIQKGGPPDYDRTTRGCQGGWQFLMPYEMSLVLDFEVDPKTNLPTGCGYFDQEMTTDPLIHERNGIPIYVGSTQGNGDAPPCQAVTYSPDGDGQSLPDIVKLFADDHDTWQKTFFNAWEKLQMNGYNPKDLKIAPANGNLMASTTKSNQP